ncbi:MAG: IS1634 family transposase [Cyclobacteriaceae bacterium]
MPSIIIDKKPSGEYIRIVESYRDQNGKPRTKTLYSLGRVDSFSPESLKRMGQRLYELGGGDLKDLLGDQVTEEGRYNYGFLLVYRKILCYYGLDRILDRITKKKKLSYSLTQVVLLLIIERLNDPCSKRSSFYHQEEYLSLPPVSLQHLYRSLDYLADHSDLIQQAIYQTGRDLFNQKLDVVFYDVTTFYFESEIEQEGALRQKGFSKDGKIGSTQVVFAMLIDRYKQPIGYKLYSGDLWEGHTYRQMVENLKKEYEIENIVLVADRGMLSTDNLQATLDQGYEFIMGERLKVLPKPTQARLVNLENYQHEWMSSSTGSQREPINVRYTVLEYNGRKVIATYSEKRAEKDRKEREEKLRKAELLLKNPSQLKKKAHHYYLKNTEGEKYVVDTEKIKRNEKYDGFLAIAYHAQGLTHTEVLDHYHHLYQIEHSFRTFKGYLETRPMFHWTNKRIQGHICLCYIAYSLLNQLQLRLARQGTPFSEQTIRTHLSKMQVSLVKQANQYFYLRSKVTEIVQKILQAVAEKNLPDLFYKDQIFKYL